MVESEEHHSFFPTYNATAQNFSNSTSNDQGSNSFINKSTLSTNTKEIIEYSKYYKEGIRDPGEEGRKASRVLFLRSFNNWVKAVVINKYCRLLGTNLSVLDLCCGRGGDLKKYFNSKVKLYVGADLSEESLKNAIDRIRKIKNEKYSQGIPCKCFFITEDISHPSNHLMEKIDKSYYFDLVSCQFAMHYHFESEAKIRAFLSNVVTRLCDGGYFIGSIIEDNVIVKRLRNRKYKDNKYMNEKLTFGNEFYSIKFYSKYFPKEKGPYGIKYGFYLEDSIDKRDEEGNIKYVGEYLVIFDEFIKLCKEYDLYLVEKKNFTDFYEENVKNFGYKKMFTNMVNDIDNSTKLQQWEIIQLYQIFVFRKGKKEFTYESQNQRNRYNRGRRDDNNNINDNKDLNKGDKYIPYLYKNPISFKDTNPLMIGESFE